MKHKSRVHSIFVTFKTLVENIFTYKIKMFQSDGAREFDPHSMHDVFLKHGIYFRKSCLDTQQKNGVVEWKHRHLLEVTRSLLIDAALQASFRLDALYATVFTINQLPTHVLHEKSPYEVLFKKTPYYSFLKPFGCTCFPHLFSTNKLSPPPVAYVFLGYASHYKGYRCFDPLTKRVHISRHVCFHEDQFPFSHLTSRLSSVPFSSSFNLQEILCLTHIATTVMPPASSHPPPIPSSPSPLPPLVSSSVSASALPLQNVIPSTSSPLPLTCSTKY